MHHRPPADPEARCRLIAEVTDAILAGDRELRLCEGLRLIEASAEAVARLAPEAAPSFRERTVPRLRRRLLGRFGIAPAAPAS